MSSPPIPFSALSSLTLNSQHNSFLLMGLVKRRFLSESCYANCFGGSVLGTSISWPDCLTQRFPPSSLRPSLTHFTYSCQVVPSENKCVHITLLVLFLNTLSRMAEKKKKSVPDEFHIQVLYELIPTTALLGGLSRPCWYMLAISRWSFRVEGPLLPAGYARNPWQPVEEGDGFLRK